MWWQQFCRTLLPPREVPTRDDIVALNRVWKFRHGECVYCGDPATTSDHFRSLMRPHDGMPSGATNDLWNRVPACTTCNASKGTRPWREFMSCTRGKAPRARGVADWRRRMQHLEAFEREGATREGALLQLDLQPFERRLRAARQQLARARDAVRELANTLRASRAGGGGGGGGGAAKPYCNPNLRLPRRAPAFFVGVPALKWRTRAYRALEAAHMSKAPLYIRSDTRAGKFLVTIVESRNASVRLHFQQCQ